MDTLTVFVIGIVFFAIVVVLIVYGVRRSTRMSDELSKEWEEKLRAIKPTTTIPEGPQAKEKEKQPPPPSKDDTVRDLPSYITVQAELRDHKTELQHLLQEIATLRENETSMRKEIDGLRTEISTLQERLQTSQEEIQELRTSIEQTVKPQMVSQTEVIQAEHIQEAKTPEQPKRGGWRARIFGSNPPTRACPNCKRTLQAQDRYCDSCGQEAPPSI